MITPPPSPLSSSPEERRQYVEQQWACLHNCELCGKCHMLRGRLPDELYADYIEGKCSYQENTLAIRHSPSGS